MQRISQLIEANKESLINNALQIFQNSGLSFNLEGVEVSYRTIFDKIFSQLERAVNKKDKSGAGCRYFARYCVSTIQKARELKQNFEVQLALLDAARVTVNQFIFENPDRFSNIKFSMIQGIFSSALLTLGKAREKLHHENQEKDHQLIGELKVVKNELQRQLNMVYQIIQKSPVGVVNCDESLNILHWNPMASRLTGFQPADILKKSITDIFHGRSRDLFLKKIYSDESITRQRLNIYRKNHEYFPAQVSVSKVKNSSRIYISYVITFQEISEQGKKRASQTQIDRLTTISRLTSAMMHDIRNPINTLGLNVEMLEKVLLQKYGSISPEAQDFINKVQRQIHNLTVSLNHYLMYTHLTDLNLEPTNITSNLTALMHDIHYMLAMKKIKLNFQTPRNAYWIMADWLQLRRVFNNLVQNATDVLGEAGEIWVKVSRRGNRIIIKIRDNGPGIAPQYFSKIFEPFYTTKESGEGLGLFICREIVLAHGGRISFKSPPGQGATFNLGFPSITRGENSS